jgi:hypothetical protein
MALALATVIGVIVSVTSTSPALLKLSLHRANDLIILFGLVYVVSGIWSDFCQGPAWRRGFAASILVSPFILDPGFPLLFSIILSAPSWLAIFSKRSGRRADWAVAAIVTVATILVAAYCVVGYLDVKKPSAYIGNSLLALFVAVIALVTTMRLQRIAMTVTAAALALGAYAWLGNAALPLEKRTMAKAYKEVQLWAKNNTPPNTLFMVDPTIYYGWRDFSQRSSFGNLREWLHTSWLYDSRPEVYREGMRRFREFGIDAEPFLRWQRPLDGGRAMERKVREVFYNAPDAWRVSVAEKYNIDYIVLKKALKASVNSLPTTYQNEEFIVVAVSTAVKRADG